MASGIETLYTIECFLPQEICLKLLNALVLSQIQYPAILVNGIPQNLTSIEKAIELGRKSLFQQQNSDSSSELKSKHSMFPFKLMLEYRSVTYF